MNFRRDGHKTKAALGSTPPTSLSPKMGPNVGSRQERGSDLFLARAPRRPSARCSHQELGEARDQGANFTKINTVRNRRSSAPKSACHSCNNDADSSSDQGRSIHGSSIRSLHFQLQKATRGTVQRPADQGQERSGHHHLWRGHSLQNIRSGKSDSFRNELNNQSISICRPVSSLQYPRGNHVTSPHADLQSGLRLSVPFVKRKSGQEYFYTSSSSPKSDSDAERSLPVSARPSAPAGKQPQDRGQTLHPSFRIISLEEPQPSNDRRPDKSDEEEDTSYECLPRDSLYPRYSSGNDGQIGTVTPQGLRKILHDGASPLERLEEVFQNAIRRRWHRLDGNNEGIGSSVSIDGSRTIHGEGQTNSSEYELSSGAMLIGSGKNEVPRVNFAIFDDRVPLSMQPQTPADLRRHTGSRTPYTTPDEHTDSDGNGAGFREQTCRTRFDRMAIEESDSSPINSPRLHGLPPTPVAHGEGFVARAMTSAHGSTTGSQRVIRGFNRSDPEKENATNAEDLDGINEERQTWYQRAETSRDGVMNRTPPRVGRFERLLHQ